jgi:hypothetical protein
MMPFACFYSYTYPEPNGFKEALVSPAEAYYHAQLREFILPYEAVRTATDPDKTLLDFLRTTYLAGSQLGKWNNEYTT